MRRTRVGRNFRAGCYDCDASWDGKNAQGVAARHHDKTGHYAWVEIETIVLYGGRASEDAEVAAARLQATPTETETVAP